jgi:hypothetical protein
MNSGIDRLLLSRSMTDGSGNVRVFIYPEKIWLDALRCSVKHEMNMKISVTDAGKIQGDRAVIQT